jgi:hypothetical protein
MFYNIILFLCVFTTGLLFHKYKIYENALYYYKNYKKGNISLKLMKDYVMFQIRHLSSYYLEIGYMECQNNFFRFTYYNGSQKYKMVFPKQKRCISYVTKENGEDISNIFFEYLGPGNNFYSIQTTPLMLSWNFPIIVGYRKNITIEERTYYPNDVILTTL